MIEVIEKKLLAWGEWSVKRESNGLGYKTTSITRLMGVPGGDSDGLPFGMALIYHERIIK